MFATRGATTQTKPTERSTSTPMPRRSTPAARPFAGGAREPAPMLQPSLGNQAMLRLLSQRARNPAVTESALPNAMQAKLVVGSVDDPLEREADRVADQVVGTRNPAPAIAAAAPRLSRKCAACEQEEHVQAKLSGSPRSGDAAPGVVHATIATSGRALEAPARAFLEPRFGRSFADVRVHDDPQASRSAAAVGARAYTVGRHIVFGNGEFRPHEPGGMRLLAHELAHVAQQGGAGSATAAADRSIDGVDSRTAPVLSEMARHAPGYIGDVTDTPALDASVPAPDAGATPPTDAGAAPPRDAGAAPATDAGAPPAGDCGSICDRAYANPSLNGGGGGVICDGATKCPCAFDVPPLARGACPEHDAIVLAHERQHMSEVDCNPSSGLHRPPFRNPSTGTASECTHRRESIAAIDRALPTSTGTCKTGMTTIRGVLQSWVTANCGGP